MIFPGRFAGKIAVVTGAAQGIGRLAANHSTSLRHSASTGSGEK
jgi:NAD(P)-dependent dehydrogenase (short-subunit alcohol dehydrogenase family)